MEPLAVTTLFVMDMKSVMEVEIAWDRLTHVPDTLALNVTNIPTSAPPAMVLLAVMEFGATA